MSIKGHDTQEDFILLDMLDFDLFWAWTSSLLIMVFWIVMPRLLHYPCMVFFCSCGRVPIGRH